jgi:hypothetical protein
VRSFPARRRTERPAEPDSWRLDLLADRLDYFFGDVTVVFFGEVTVVGGQPVVGPV